MSLQREIVADALRYVKSKGGRLVFMTQSILNEENAQQVMIHSNIKMNGQIIDSLFVRYLDSLFLFDASTSTC